MPEIGVSYLQSADDRYVGVVVFNGEPRPANGRLDYLGAQVLAAGFEYQSKDHGRLRVVVQCRRNDDGRVGFGLTFINDWGTVVREIIVEGECENMLGCGTNPP